MPGIIYNPKVTIIQCPSLCCIHSLPPLWLMAHHFRVIIVGNLIRSWPCEVSSCKQWPGPRGLRVMISDQQPLDMVMSYPSPGAMSCIPCRHSTLQIKSRGNVKKSFLDSKKKFWLKIKYLRYFLIQTLLHFIHTLHPFCNSFFLSQWLR